MSRQTVLHNARIVLSDRVIKGAVVLKDEIIRQIDESDRIHYQGVGIDCEGDFLIPGLIEMHTDNLEKYIVPRPGIYWPSMEASIIAHDNQIFNSGITTVLDAVALGFSDTEEARTQILDRSISAVIKASENQWLRADHFLHLRCELPSASVLDSFSNYVTNPLVKLVSVMDHTPGQRQWRDLVKWRIFHKEKKWTDEEAKKAIQNREELREKHADDNRHEIVRICRALNLPIASHDDTTVDHCQTAYEDGIKISEFPTTYLAAQKAKALGMFTIMGAPNMIRGESHSGNISARSLIENQLLDGFSSDYMPISLLHAAFEMHRLMGTPLHHALATVTTNIAKMVCLNDRGVLASGKKADILRVRLVDHYPIIITIWKAGNQVLSH